MSTSSIPQIPSPSPSPSSLEEKLAKWRNEQYHIASQVIIHPTTPSLALAMTPEYSSSSYIFQPTENHRDKLYGGVDVTFAAPITPGDKECGVENCQKGVAVYVILRGNEIVYSDHEIFESCVPYVSSYLTFREIEPLERLVKHQMSHKPEVTPHAILVDGNGIMHCRKAGLACFLGVRTGLKTIGVGKTFYCHDGLTHDLVNWSIEKGLEKVVSKNFRGMSSDHDANGDNNDVVMFDQTISIDGGITDIIPSTPPPDKMRDHVQKLPSSCIGYVMTIKGASGTTWGACLVAHGGVIAG
eukprot:CAMPEP_0172497230 /NCGR_PEP_ID=MMETSP1066-20121228/96943_1 /TAXON_ID=671091 /ORGANISM="Coscinodiscus wailesii, Strain CCMP2513" /LENGTH=298 /DNA_ID=CAMNT_0013269879 /DNA_START=38 /DNA_END=930 /DNA_ORIENTATION=+